MPRNEKGHPWVTLSTRRTKVGGGKNISFSNKNASGRFKSLWPMGGQLGEWPSIRTMTKSAMLRARIEPDLKSEGEDVLKQIGLSTSDFITMTFRQLVMLQGVPFEVHIPNAETIVSFN